MIDCGNRRLGATSNMGAEKVAIVHPVDVIPRQNERELRLMLLEKKQVLKDGVGSSRVALSGGRRTRKNKFVVAGSNPAPSFSEIRADGVTMMLRERTHAFEAGVEAIGKCEIHDSVAAAKRNKRLRTVPCERIQAAALSTGQDKCEGSGRNIFI